MKFKKINCKGQVSSYDVLIAVLLFMIMFLALRQVAINNIDIATNDLAYNEMKIHSQQALDSLIKTKGYPTNWNVSDVELIGLAERPDVLSSEKVQNFIIMDYNIALDLLALGKYDFFFEIDSVNDDYDLNFGIVLVQKEVVRVERLVLYKEEEANVLFSVFK